MKTKDLRSLQAQELIEKEKTLKKELFDLNFQKRHGRVEKPGRFRMIRRDIARILTLLKEKEHDGTKDASKRQ